MLAEGCKLNPAALRAAWRPALAAAASWRRHGRHAEAGCWAAHLPACLASSSGGCWHWGWHAPPAWHAWPCWQGRCSPSCVSPSMARAQAIQCLLPSPEQLHWVIRLPNASGPGCLPPVSLSELCPAPSGVIAPEIAASPHCAATLRQLEGPDQVAARPRQESVRAPGGPAALRDAAVGDALQAGPDRPGLLRDVQLRVGDNTLSGSACSPAPGYSASARPDQPSMVVRGLNWPHSRTRQPSKNRSLAARDQEQSVTLPAGSHLGAGAVELALMLGQRIPVALLCLGRDGHILRLGLSTPRPNAPPSSSGGSCRVLLRCRPGAARDCIACCRPTARRLLCSARPPAVLCRSCSQVHSQVYLQALYLWKQ